MTDTDTERDERLRAARNVAAFLRAQEPDARAMGLSEGERAVILALDDAVARLDAVVTAVREALADHPRCDQHTDDDPITCGWKRAVADVQSALDGGAAQ